jgi:hypothetical protein
MILDRNRARKLRIRPSLLGGTLAIVFLAFAAGSAPGGNVNLPGSGTAEGGPLRLYAGPGEDNHVTVGLDAAGAQYEISDSAGIPAVSGNCTRLSATSAHCPAFLVTSIDVDLGNGSDSFQVVGNGVGVPLSVRR